MTGTPKRGYRDLMAVTGLGAEVVKAAIRDGRLPGYQIGRSYVVPEEAFQRFCKGDWVAAPRPVEPIRALPTAEDFVRRRVS